MRNIYLIFFTIFLLFPNCQQLSWQGYGNMSSENLTAIWSYINNNIGTFANQNQFDDFSTGLSNNLNNLWAPAWNVITVQTVEWSDTILYGYAFRYHWMWYNNYKVGTQTFSFVIWKDYNCQNWKNVGQSFSKPAFQTTNYNALSVKLQATFASNSPISDVWLQTKTFMDSLSTVSGFSGNDKAFSIVFSQDAPNTRFYGRVCLVSDNWIYNPIASDSLSSSSGLFLLFQTRSTAIPSQFVNQLTSSQIENYRNAELQRHNLYRVGLGSGSLVINTTLNEAAQSYSEYLATQAHSLKHSDAATAGSYGQNLYWGWGAPTYTYGSTVASTQWYSQSQSYVFNSFPPVAGTGHFTAMIWKAVTSVGFGYYKVKENQGYAIYIVANYYPTPNIYTKQQYDANIQEPSGGD